MKKFLPFLFVMTISPAMANSLLTLDDALRATYMACVGIGDELAELKKMAGINTAVTSVGTAAGVGATVTGFVKASKDAKAEALEAILKEITDLQKNASGMTDEQITVFVSEFNDSYQTVLRDKAEIESELQKTIKQSKKLGNWRTGLLATGTVTNIAGAIIASGNKADGNVKTSIDACRAAVNTLRSSIMQARLNGTDVSEAQNIANICGEYDYVDLSKIDTKAKGATISSGVGALTGVTGTVLSASANSDKVRDDNSNTGKQKEKSLNTAANVLSIATTAASATATVFNATQIGAIKQVAQVAEKCTGVLK